MTKKEYHLLGHKWVSKAGDAWLTITTKAEFIKETKNKDYVQVSFKLDDLNWAIENFETQKPSKKK